MIVGVPLWLQIALPIFVLAIKLIVMNYCIYDFKKNKKISNENIQTKAGWLFVAVCLILAYGLPAINITINGTMFFKQLLSQIF